MSDRSSRCMDVRDVIIPSASCCEGWGGEEEKMSAKRSFGFIIVSLVERSSIEVEVEVEKRVWLLSISIFVIRSCGCD